MRVGADIRLVRAAGTGDQVVQYAWGKESVDVLQKMGYKHIDFHSYPGMPHSLCQEEQEDVAKFISRVSPRACGSSRRRGC